MTPEILTATQLSPEDVKRRLIKVCRELSALVAGSYGPLGKAQLLQANAQCSDALTITSVAERYFANLNVGDCPIANVYFHILKSKIRNHADAGLFLAGLSANLQLEIQEGCLAQIPHSIINRGLQLVLEWSLQYLDDAKCPMRVAVDWSSAVSISAVIRGIISSKSTTRMDAMTMDTVIIPLIIQAFVSVFGYVVEHPCETVPVQLLFVPGLYSIAESKTWKQTMFLDLPWPNRGRYHANKQSSLSPPICNRRVALFNITIEPIAEDSGNDSSTSVKHTSSMSSYRLKALRQLGDQLERLGATAVLSQKIIPKYLQTYLAAKGIFTLDRLSATNIRGVQMLSGATILSNWRIDDSISSASLGFLSLITTQTLGSKHFIRLHREDSTSQTSLTADSGNAHPVTTIAIAAPDLFGYDELCHVVTTSLKTLASLIHNPYVVAGAGCLEIHLAALLRHRASQLRIPRSGTNSAAIDTQARRTLRQLSQTVISFADCLETLAGRLCGSHATAVDRATMLEKVSNANSKSLLTATALSDAADLSNQSVRTFYGWDPLRRSVVPVLVYKYHDESGSDQEKIVVDACVFDVVETKKDALVLAIESVTSLASISLVVRAP